MLHPALSLIVSLQVVFVFSSSSSYLISMITYNALHGPEFSHPSPCCWSTHSSETRRVAMQMAFLYMVSVDCTHGLEGCWPLKVKAHDQRHTCSENCPRGLHSCVASVVVCLSQSTSLSFVDLDFASLAGEKWHLHGGLICICCVKLSILTEVGAGQSYFLLCYLLIFSLPSGAAILLH